MSGSQQERPLQIEGLPDADVLDPSLSIGAEEIEAQAVFFRIYLVEKAASQMGPIGRRNLALENRELNPLAVILAGLGDAPQACRPARSVVLTS